MKSRGKAPWICAGDFNEITKQSKIGGRTRSHGQMQAFRDVLDECDFMDLGFVGPMFTWHKHFEDYTVWEHLDRAIATNDWFAIFPNTKVYHLDVTASDHKALLIQPEGMECSQQKPFRFEQVSMAEQGCGATIEAVWKKDIEATDSTNVLRKVQNCGEALSKWSKTNFGSVRRELQEKRKLLSKAELAASRDVAWVRRLEQEINSLLDCEAQMWSQRSKIQWLRVEIEIPSTSIAKLLNVDAETTSRGYMIKRADGGQNRVEWWKLWWIFIKGCSPLQTRPALMKY